MGTKKKKKKHTLPKVDPSKMAVLHEGLPDKTFLREGKTKSNVKKPPLECKICGYHASGNAFDWGILWWKQRICPKCGSKRLKDYQKPNIIPLSHSLRTDDKVHLQFIYDRLVGVHGENKNEGYMIRFAQIIKK